MNLNRGGQRRTDMCQSETGQRWTEVSMGGRTTSNRTCQREEGQRRIGCVNRSTVNVGWTCVNRKSDSIGQMCQREAGQLRIGRVNRRTDNVKSVVSTGGWTMSDGHVSIGNQTALDRRVNGRTDNFESDVSIEGRTTSNRTGQQEDGQR